VTLIADIMAVLKSIYSKKACFCCTYFFRSSSHASVSVSNKRMIYYCFGHRTLRCVVLVT
jgi:hypothetical protein